MPLSNQHRKEFHQGRNKGDLRFPRSSDTSRIAKIFKQVQNHSKIWVTTVLVFSGTPFFAHELSAEKSSYPASLSDGASGDAQGDGIDLLQKLSDVETEIQNITNQIAELEGRGLDVLSDDEFDRILSLQDRVVALENQRQVYQAAIIASNKEQIATNAEVIENYDNALGNLNAVNSQLVAQ